VLPGSQVARAPFQLTRFIFDNSLLLVAGTLAAVVWANVDADTYARVSGALQFAVNDVGMVFFFALAAKEVFEATLPDGALASPRQAMSPLFSALGGMVAPAGIFVLLVFMLGPQELSRGWAIPCATDIAFSAMIARLIFRADHPAIPFLLLLAIADDALGLIILALFYPTGHGTIGVFVVLMASALGLAWWLKRRRTRSFWPYVAGPGVLSWAALHFGGLHPALAMVPIVPFMAHGPRDLGLFNLQKAMQTDTLSRFEHWWWIPVQFVLLVFGLANAGVLFQEIGPGTYYVLVALLVGKPLGIVAFAIGATFLGMRLPDRLGIRDLVVVGMTAAIGFTVALFFATAAFPPGLNLAQAKMGALLSFAAAPLAWLAARVLGVGRQRI
jgi:NhaA family Na+:H+ antiporter